MKKYHGFMSYSHRVNQGLVARLQRDVQRFGRGFLSPWSVRIFRDASDLTSHPGLWPELQERLRQSEHLLYLATPQAAASPWIRKELSYWASLHEGRLDNFLVVLLDGEIVFQSQGGVDWSKTTALPRWLDDGDSEENRDLGAALPDEPKYLDLRWARDQAAPSLKDPRYFDVVASLAAAVQGQDKLELIYRDAAEQRRTLRSWKVASWLFLGLLAVVGWSAWEIQRSRMDSTQARAQMSQRRAQALYKEVADNLRIADLHLGLLKVLAGGMSWPLDGWSERTTLVRTDMAGAPFSESQLIGLQVQPELVPEEVWKLATELYYSQRRAQESIRRGMIALDDLDRAHMDSTMVEQAAMAHLKAIELSYQNVWTSGSKLLVALDALGDVDPNWVLEESQLRLLPRLNEHPIASAAEEAIAGIGPGFLLKTKIAQADPSDKELHLMLFVEARTMQWPSVAASVVSLIRERFPQDASMMAYAKAARAILDIGDKIGSMRGVAVTGFDQPSAGQKAGIEAGDVVLIYSGHTLRNSAELAHYIGKSRPDFPPKVTVLREKEILRIEVPAGRLGLDVADM